jgi:hypothetical protein
LSALADSAVQKTRRVLRQFSTLADKAEAREHKKLTPFSGAPMADNLNNRGAGDRARININEPHEIRYWTDALQVSEAELRAAVASVGVSAEEVRLHLGMAPQSAAARS